MRLCQYGNVFHYVFSECKANKIDFVCFCLSERTKNSPFSVFCSHWLLLILHETRALNGAAKFAE